MGVDGGAGNAISLSEVQTFYGGSNPISMSEYYRNGSLVPGDLVTAQSNTSGSSSQTIGQFAVTVSSASGSTGSFVSRVSSNTSGIGYTVDATDATVVASVSGANNDGTANIVVRVTRSGSNIGDFSKNLGGSQSAGIFLKGPLFSGSGVSSSGYESLQLAAGDVVTIIQAGAEIPITTTISTQRRPTLFDVVYTNNNASTITTTSGSTGGAQSYTQNQSRTVIDDASSASYTLGYDAVNGNTNVPTSGTINMNVFNAPGSAAP